MVDLSIHRELLGTIIKIWKWGIKYPIGILGQVWYLIVSIPDLCPLSYLHQMVNKEKNICVRMGQKNPDLAITVRQA